MFFRCAIVLMLVFAVASCMPGRRAESRTTQSDAEYAMRPALTQTQPPEAAGRAYMMTPGAGAASAVPDMESGRKINSQDCTKEINLTAGNLKCQ